MRTRKLGSSSTGSTKPRNVRFGSAFEITARAPISRPSSRTTPEARPSRTITRATDAPVRISAPASVAASAMARVSAPGPPLTVMLLPPGAGSTAAFSSNAAPVPADQGPCATPKMPRAATAACRRSAENHSATRSAAGIGIQRSSRNESDAPERAKPPPGLQQIPQLADAAARRARAASFRGARRETRPVGSRTCAELRICRGVGIRERADGLDGCGDVARKRQRPAIRRKRHEPRIGRDELDAASRQPHVAHDRGRTARSRARASGTKPGAISSVIAPPPTMAAARARAASARLSPGRRQW